MNRFQQGQGIWLTGFCFAHRVRQQPPMDQDVPETVHSQDEILALAATPERLRHLARPLGFTETDYLHALELAGARPKQSDWVRMIGHFLLLYGTLLIMAGIAAFFAYNWAGLPAMAKFGLIEAGMALAIVLAWHRGLDSLIGKSALFSAAFVVGVLLAVYGQVYQTGADPYSLFLGWAVLIAAWTVIGRQAGLWMLMLVLLNLSLTLFWVQVLYPPSQIMDEVSQLLGPLFWLAHTMGDFRLAQLLFVFNASVLLLWEFFSARGVPWMQGRWFPRVVATGALAIIVSSTLILIFGSLLDINGRQPYASPLAFMIFTAACLWYYQKRCQDLFILTVCLLGVIVVITSWVARSSHGGFEIALTLSLLVIGQTAGAAFWLRGVARRWRTSV